MNDLKTSPRMSVENKQGTHNNSPLPPNKLPQCWDQDERMSALFSPFRSKGANPQDWVSKYKFWHDLIYEWLKHTMRCSFTVTDLSEIFKRNGCSPLCLTTVVEELIRNNEIIPESEYLKEPCESWTAWSIDMFLKKPLTWSFCKVRSYVISPEINRETKYIHLPIIREFEDIILSILKNKKENVLVPFSEIVKCCKSDVNQNISENTVMLGLIWLRRSKKIAFKNGTNENEVLVKLSTNTMDDITETDEGLYNLMKQENELIKKIQLMEEEKINIINEVKSYLSKGLRQVAKTYLKKKVELEKAIEKQAQVLENLQTLILTIQNTHSNSAVLSAYKSGSDMLKKVNEKGLSEFDVRDVMDNLSEILQEHKEVDSLLSETIQSNDSDADLEEELAALVQLDDNVLPSTPNTESNSDIEQLHQRLKNLQMEDLSIMDETPSKSRLEHNHKKKALIKPFEI